MLLQNHSSWGQTKDFLIKKGQGLIDCEHDSRTRYKCVQIYPTEWYVWCFEDKGDSNEINQWSWTELPKFIRVQKISLITLNGKKFLHCNCSFWERVCIPCRHMMVVLSRFVENSMVDIHWLKAYYIGYRNDWELG